jgi:hypothetical protein
MPKIPINYANTVIYKIVHKEDFDNVNIYIGSTTDFTRRKTKHKYDCNKINGIGYDCKKYQYIRENGGWECFNMIEIEKYPCNDKREAEAREEYWRCHYNAQLNSISAYLTDEQRKNKCIKNSRIYYDENRNAVLKQKKDYYIANRDKILESKKVYYNDNKKIISMKSKARYIYNKHTKHHYSNIKNEDVPISCSLCMLEQPALI